MGKMTFDISESNENKLRELNRKKGDLSNNVNKALDQYFSKKEA
jgi:hypothetical protein